MCDLSWRVSCAAVLLACAPGTAAAQSGDTLQQAIDTHVQTQSEAVVSQQRVDALSAESRELLEEYRAVLQETQTLRSYNAQLERLVRQQQESSAALERELAGAADTRRLIVPFLRRMVEVLADAVQLDLPFLREERRLRLNNLTELLDRGDVSLPEKYRRVMEAYQVEMDYGRTIEAYIGQLGADGSDRTVEFLRVGRIALVYQTLDRREAGRWDRAAGGWVLLPQSELRAITQALKVARREAPPDLIRIPVPGTDAAP